MSVSCTTDLGAALGSYTAAQPVGSARAVGVVGTNKSGGMFSVCGGEESSVVKPWLLRLNKMFTELGWEAQGRGPYQLEYILFLHGKLADWEQGQHVS